MQQGLLSRCRDRALALARGTGGNILVEFALTAPILMLAFVGLIDYGAQYYKSMSLDAAARSGIQYLAANPSDIAGAKVATQMATTLASDQLAVNVTKSCECSGGGATDCNGTCPAGEAMRIFFLVDATMPHQNVLNYPGITNPSALTGKATIRVQ